ncbi:MAG TPA: hypothetical protein VN222_04110, partial [Novosphingobium sp.]|nr:hypothetical protein [Novosphingobium sp.]
VPADAMSDILRDTGTGFVQLGDTNHPISPEHAYDRFAPETADVLALNFHKTVQRPSVTVWRAN